MNWRADIEKYIATLDLSPRTRNAILRGVYGQNRILTALPASAITPQSFLAGVASGEIVLDNCGTACCHELALLVGTEPVRRAYAKGERKLATRRDMDAYYTPPGMTEALLRKCMIRGRVLEPCAGDGSISVPLRAVGCRVFENDLDKSVGTAYNENAADPKAAIWRLGLDWVVTNPPYSLAPLIVYNALMNYTNVAMLLRLSFLEPCKNRADILTMYPLSKLIVFGQPRPSFTADGRTDAATVAWFVWEGPGKRSGTELSFATNWRGDFIYDE